MAILAKKLILSRWESALRSRGVLLPPTHETAFSRASDFVQVFSLASCKAGTAHVHFKPTDSVRFEQTDDFLPVMRRSASGDAGDEHSIREGGSDQVDLSANAQPKVAE
jgi:hypothetical protein